MKKLIFAVIVLSIGYLTMAKAEETKTYTPQEFVQNVASVPGKLHNHIQNEWEEIKVYQANSWAEMKFKFLGFKDKFLSQ